MSNTFNIQKLAGQRVLVSGDSAEQREILSSVEWDSLQHKLAHVAAEDSFGEAVAEFFAPLLEAAEKAEADLLATLPKPDEAFTLVVSEGTEGTEAEAPVIITLSRDTAILRMIDSGDTSRLVWVGSSIEVLAA